MCLSFKFFVHFVSICKLQACIICQLTNKRIQINQLLFENKLKEFHSHSTALSTVTTFTCTCMWNAVLLNIEEVRKVPFLESPGNFAEMYQNNFQCTQQFASKVTFPPIFALNGQSKLCEKYGPMFTWSQLGWEITKLLPSFPSHSFQQPLAYWYCQTWNNYVEVYHEWSILFNYTL